MTFKSKEQPYCHTCGKPIKKRTGTVFVEADRPIEQRYRGDTALWRHVYLDEDSWPRNKADCQRLINDGTVVSVTYHRTGSKVGLIQKFSTWDGESYESEFFCSTPCAIRLAYACARAGKVLPAYNERMTALQAKTKEKT